MIDDDRRAWLRAADVTERAFPRADSALNENGKMQIYVSRRLINDSGTRELTVENARSRARLLLLLLLLMLPERARFQVLLPPCDKSIKARRGNYLAKTRKSCIGGSFLDHDGYRSPIVCQSPNCSERPSCNAHAVVRLFRIFVKSEPVYSPPEREIEFRVSGTYDGRVSASTVFFRHAGHLKLIYL